MVPAHPHTRVGIGGALLALVDFLVLSWFFVFPSPVSSLLVFRLFLAFVSSREDLCFCLMLGLRRRTKVKVFLLFLLFLVCFLGWVVIPHAEEEEQGKARHTHTHTK
jgi:hypothetical protein